MKLEDLFLVDQDWLDHNYDEGIVLIPHNIVEEAILRDLIEYINSTKYNPKELQLFLDKKLEKAYLNDQTN